MFEEYCTIQQLRVWDTDVNHCCGLAMSGGAKLTSATVPWLRVKVRVDYSILLKYYIIISEFYLANLIRSTTKFHSTFS